jgi:hypothetical protein
MTKHKVAHLPLWQGIFQNNDSSWRGFYSNRKGCDCHKGYATKWSGSVAAHLRFHLHKWGVTNDSALTLIQKSFTSQALRDAIQAMFKGGKVVSATQAKMQEEFEDEQCHAPRVDITQGMEASERLEYEQETWGRAPLLDPSNPEALNFNKKQLFKSLKTAGTNGSMFTTPHLVLLGGTVYELKEEDEIDSQESNIFESSKVGSNKEENIKDYEGPIIKNIDTIRPNWTENLFDKGPEEDTAVGMEEDLEKVEVVDLVHSPAKVTRIALERSGFPTEVTNTQHNNITQMIQKWVDENDNHNLLANLTKLASRAGIVVSNLVADITDTTPQQRDRREKAKQPTIALVAGDAMEGALSGL